MEILDASLERTPKETPTSGNMRRGTQRGPQLRDPHTGNKAHLGIGRAAEHRP